MARFEETRWADPVFVQEYMDTADDVIPNRNQMTMIALSLYRSFGTGRSHPQILDLGCGDGRLTETLLEADDTAQITAVDASPMMLASARQRLDGNTRVRFVEATFQRAVAEDLLPGPFDCIVSFLAIHHIDTREKLALLQYVHNHLIPGGLFVIADPVRPVSQALEAWSLDVWRQWAKTYFVPKAGRAPGLIPERLGDMIDPLAPQMKALETIGFREVDCYYKHGMFAMFGGRRPPL